MTVLGLDGVVAGVEGARCRCHDENDAKSVGSERSSSEPTDLLCSGFRLGRFKDDNNGLGKHT